LSRTHTTDCGTGMFAGKPVQTLIDQRCQLTTSKHNLLNAGNLSLFNFKITVFMTSSNKLKRCCVQIKINLFGTKVQARLGISGTRNVDTKIKQD
jgi:hypothetical protein